MANEAEPQNEAKNAITINTKGSDAGTKQEAAMPWGNKVGRPNQRVGGCTVCVKYSKDKMGPGEKSYYKNFFECCLKYSTHKMGPKEKKSFNKNFF